jgi:hypothetical protein
MTGKMNDTFKKIIVDRWKDEVVYNQRVLFDLAQELHELGWYDEQVWMLIFKTTVEKKRINNIYDFGIMFNIMSEINSGHNGLCTHLKGKAQPFMDTIIKKHYTEDRKWKYDVENRRMRTLQELIDRREECGPND